MTHVLTWLREVDDRARADTSRDRPPTQAITLVAHFRVLHADPDGSNCYPAQSTLARLAGVDRTTVRAVDAWLVDSGLMKLVRNRARGQREYLLEADSDGGDGGHLEGVDNSPDGGGDHTLAGESDGGLDDYLNENLISDGGSDEAQMVGSTTTTFDLPPDVKGLSSDQREPVDNRAPPDDHDVWQEAHPHIPLAEAI